MMMNTTRRTKRATTPESEAIGKLKELNPNIRKNGLRHQLKKMVPLGYFGDWEMEGSIGGIPAYWEFGVVPDATLFDNVNNILHMFEIVQTNGLDDCKIQKYSTMMMKFDASDWIFAILWTTDRNGENLIMHMETGLRIPHEQNGYDQDIMIGMIRNHAANEAWGDYGPDEIPRQ